MATGSTQEPEAPTPSGAGNGNPPLLEGSSKPSAHTQHFPGPSSEESWDGGSSSEDPCMSLSLTPVPVALVAPVPSVAPSLTECYARALARRQEAFTQKQFDQALRSPSPVPSIASVLRKRSPSPPPPTSPRPCWAPLLLRLRWIGMPGCNTSGPLIFRTTQASPCQRRSLC